MMKFILLAALVVIAVASSSSVVSAQQQHNLRITMNATLSSSTQLSDTTLSNWDYPQSSFFKIGASEFYAVTTNNGALQMLDAVSGKVLWTRTDWPECSVADQKKRATFGVDDGPNAAAFFVFQCGVLYRIAPLSGQSLWNHTVAPNGGGHASQLWAFGNQVVALFGETCVAFAGEDGSQMWKINDRVPGSWWRSDPNKNYFAYMSQRNVITVLSRNGVPVIRQPVETERGSYALVASVDAVPSVLVLYSGSNPKGDSFCRYSPHVPAVNFCTYIGPGEHIAGYSLINGPDGGGNSTLFNTLFINTKTVTHSIVWQTGKIRATSPPHSTASGHLVGLDKFATRTIQQSAGSSIVAYTWDEMKPAWAISATQLAGMAAYQISWNWYTEGLCPLPHGIGFVFGDAGLVDMSFKNAFGTAAVAHNTIFTAQRGSVFVTAGTQVYRFQYD